MRKSQWSDSQLEEMIRQMPKIKDHRDPRDIYQNIASRTKKRKRAAWLIPSAAAAAAFFLLILLAPDLMNWQGQESAEKNSSMSDHADQKMETANLPPDNQSGESPKKEQAALFNERFGEENRAEDQILDEPKVANAEDRTAIYEEDLPGNEVFTFGIPNEMAQVVVPVSVVVEKEESKSWFEQFKGIIPRLKEQEWGLHVDYPLKADMRYHADTRTIDLEVDEDQQYGRGSTAQIMFKSVLSETFGNMDVDKINLFTEGEPGILLDNEGYVRTLDIDRKDQFRHAYYFLYAGSNDRPFIVPSRETAPSIRNAFNMMKKDDEQLGLQASLPENLQFSVENAEPDKDRGILRIRLDKGATLSNQMVPNVEAILLTAKSFGFRAVKFDNANTDQVGPFSLKEEIKVPVAANKRELDQ